MGLTGEAWGGCDDDGERDIALDLGVRRWGDQDEGG